MNIFSHPAFMKTDSVANLEKKSLSTFVQREGLVRIVPGRGVNFDFHSREPGTRTFVSQEAGIRNPVRVAFPETRELT